MKKLLILFIGFYFFIHHATQAQCGSERWLVKTLQDTQANQINFAPMQSTVHQQRMYHKPVYHETNKRDSTEKQVYVITCTLLKYKLEADSDYHLVVKDIIGTEQLVLEIPAPSCTGTPLNSHFAQLAAIRKKINSTLGKPSMSKYKTAPAGTKIKVTGVGFFDKKNHPTGFKGRELHPVIDLEFL